MAVGSRVSGELDAPTQEPLAKGGLPVLEAEGLAVHLVARRQELEQHPAIGLNVLPGQTRAQDQPKQCPAGVADRFGDDRAIDACE